MGTGPGWAKHVTAEVALGTREGSSVRGGSLGGLHDGALADAASVDKVIDAAVAGGRRPQGRCGEPAVLRCGAAAAWWTPAAPGRVRRAGHRTQRRAGLGRAPGSWVSSGLDKPVSAAETVSDAELIDLVTTELGSDWPRLVAPVFDGRKAVVFDDRWASAREDLAKLWLLDESEIDADWERLSQSFEGAGQRRGHPGQLVAGQALAAGRTRARRAVRPRRGRCGEPGQGWATPTRSPW